MDSAPFAPDRVYVEDGSVYAPLLFDGDVEDALGCVEPPRLASLDSLEDVDGASMHEQDVLRVVDDRFFVETVTLDSLVDSYERLQPDRYEALRHDVKEDVHTAVQEGYDPEIRLLDTLVFDVLPYYVDLDRDVLDRETQETGDAAVRQRVLEELPDAEVEQYEEEVKTLTNTDILREALYDIKRDHGEMQPLSNGLRDADEFQAWVEEAVKASLLDRERERIAAVLEEEESGSIVDEIGRDRLALIRAVQDQGEIAVDDFGIMEEGSGRWIAYKWTEEYALRDSNGHVYHFQPAQVGVLVDGNEIGRPSVVNMYKHPFLSGHSTRQPLCIRRWSQDPSFSGENVIDAIDSGIGTVLHAYHDNDSHMPHNPLEDGYLDDHRVSSADALPEGVSVTNEYRV